MRAHICSTLVAALVHNCSVAVVHRCACPAYLTTVRTGQPSWQPAVNDIHHNFIVSDGSADGGAIDNDDGSSWYNEHHNFCIYGGAKMGNIDGHAKVYHSNVNAYANVSSSALFHCRCVDHNHAALYGDRAVSALTPTQVYGKTCFWNWPGWFPEAPYREQYFNNTCILDEGQNYIKMPNACSFKNATSVGVVTHGNHVYADGTGAVVRPVCDSVSVGASALRMCACARVHVR